MVFCRQPIRINALGSLFSSHFRIVLSDSYGIGAKCDFCTLIRKAMKHQFRTREPLMPFFKSLAKGLLSVIVLLCAPSAWSRNYSKHEGYLASTQHERATQIRDMVVIQPPPPEGPTLRERIFNDKLSREFRERYEEKFGRTEVERVYNSPNKFTYYDDLYGFKGTPQEVSDERRRFGEFMMRRLMEHHIDNYAKSDPKARVVWEAKERLSNVQLQVSEFRFDVAYSISGNTMDLKIVNPWVNSKIVLMMDPGRFGPGPVEETELSISKELTQTTSIETHWKINDGVHSVVGRKALSSALGASLSSSTFTKDVGKTRRESVYLAGMTYSF